MFARRIMFALPVILAGLLVAASMVATGAPPASAQEPSTDELVLSLSADEVLGYMSQPGWVGDVEAVKTSLRQSKAESTAVSCSERPSFSYIALAVGPGPVVGGRKSVMTVRTFRNPDPSLEHRWGPGFGGDYSLTTNCMQADNLVSARFVTDENMRGSFTATYGLYVHTTNQAAVGPVTVNYTYPFQPAATATSLPYPAPSRTPEAYPTPTATVTRGFSGQVSTQHTCRQGNPVLREGIAHPAPLPTGFRLLCVGLNDAYPVFQPVQPH